jgi:hypothetical protein
LLCITGEYWAVPDPSIGDWEAKATRARGEADRMVNPAAVRIMLELARYYDLLASEARDYVASAQLGNEILNTG